MLLYYPSCIPHSLPLLTVLATLLTNLLLKLPLLAPLMPSSTFPIVLYLGVPPSFSILCLYILILHNIISLYILIQLLNNVHSNYYSVMLHTSYSHPQLHAIHIITFAHSFFYCPAGVQATSLQDTWWIFELLFSEMFHIIMIIVAWCINVLRWRELIYYCWSMLTTLWAHQMISCCI